MQEVRARGGELYVFADADTQSRLRRQRDPAARAPRTAVADPARRAAAVLAYHTALVRGTDVDKPRNLAKSVTVE